MKVSPIYRRRLRAAAVILAGAAAVAGALSPAASDEVRPFLQSLGIISCTSSGPCQEGKNAGTGAGLEGISAKGKGVIGQTTFNSTSSSNGQVGVIGQDKSTSGSFNVGVKGTSTNGNGVVGATTHGLGVYGTASASDGYGVYGVSSSGVGGRFDSTNARGLIATSNNDDAMNAFTYHNSTTSGYGKTAVVGGDGSTDGGRLNFGVLGFSTNGTGVLGESSNWVGVNAVGGFLVQSPQDTLPALSVVGVVNSAVAPFYEDLIDACPSGTANPCDSLNSVFRVDGIGDVTIYGSGSFFVDGGGAYFKGVNCVAGCTSSATTARRVLTYSPQSSQPLIEDNGEAQLVNGTAYVRVDPAFANVINQRAIYSVSITPEGDSNGLFVTQKTLTGFAVHENHGGKSTLAFEYRIVARPYGSTGARLPMIDEPLRVRHTSSRSSHQGSGIPGR